MTVKILPEYFADKPGQLNVRCRINEGDLSVTKREGFRGLQLDYAFTAGASGPTEDENGIVPGDQVVLVGVDSEGYIIVKKRTHTDEQVFGEIISKVDFRGVGPKVGTYTDGSYDQREATIFVYGQRIRQLRVYLAQSNDLAVGNFLKPAAVSGYGNYFQESTTLTSRIALQAVTASSSAAKTATIAVLEGYESGTTVDAT